MSRTAVVKHPGESPFVHGISTSDDALTSLIGFTYRTRQIAQEEPLFMLFAQPESIHGVLPQNVWTPEGAIRGTVVVVRKRGDGGIESLRDADVSWVLSHLQERAMPHESSDHTQRKSSPAQRELERKARREHNREILHGGDDLTLAIRGSALIEHHLNEILKKSVPSAERLAGHNLTYQQIVMLLGALDRLSAADCTLLLKLGEVRNKFAHDASFAPAPALVRTLRDMAIALNYDIEYLEYHIKQLHDDRGTLLSEESAALCAIYQAVINALENAHEDPFG